MPGSETLLRIIRNKHHRVLTIAFFLYILSVALRFFRLDQRIWFNADHTIELLYAWNIAKYHMPLMIGMPTSGSNVPNLPIYLNFLGFLTWIMHGNPIHVIYAVVAIISLTAPLLFLWGVIEGSELSGFIAAIIYVFAPPCIEMANIWGNFLAIVPSIMGILFFRYAVNYKIRLARPIGIILLAVAASIHYSHLALLIAIIAIDFFRTRNFRQFLQDCAFSGVILGSQFYLMETALFIRRPLDLPAIRYSHHTCVFCMTKIPIMLSSTAGWFIQRFSAPFTQLFLNLTELGLLIVGYAVRKKIKPWFIVTPVVFLLIAGLFAGQPVFWYLFPLLPFTLLLFGEIISASLKTRLTYLRFISTSVLLCLGVLIICSYPSYFAQDDNQFQKTIDITKTVRNTMADRGITPNRYVEYSSGLDKDWISFWLIRQWLFDDELTYNDPVSSYGPMLINQDPQYLVYLHFPNEIGDDQTREAYVNYVFLTTVLDKKTGLRMDIYENTN